MKSFSFATLAALLLGISAVCGAGAEEVFYTQGSRARKAIALTFDDGPGNDTRKILSVLKQYGVKATFFMQGAQVDSRPAIAGEVAAAGHEIGNHTYRHINFYSYANDDREQLLSEEIEKTAAAIMKATGTAPRLLRMPNGYVRPWVKDIARRNRYKLVNWSFGCDWKKMPVDRLLESYVKSLEPGAIFLLHDGGGNRGRTADMLGRLIEEARRQGYAVVTVSELLSLAPPTAVHPPPQGNK